MLSDLLRGYCSSDCACPAVPDLSGTVMPGKDHGCEQEQASRIAVAVERTIAMECLSARRPQELSQGEGPFSSAAASWGSARCVCGHICPVHLAAVAPHKSSSCELCGYLSHKRWTHESSPDLEGGLEWTA